ncbi:protein of unknown function [Singulisphaera sp. GP187]|uniref:3-keto-disaccharide hydrolase n=1 Tax=Singulisphaera sp. GP187 TaxID=1882752 RepID=UPI00092C3669|nr:DUF1080 domain-containing protein [Singulisphaera sp. GP187]SIN82472.1 protein of unknown function [Singulisphaera sp. GP187]
MTPLRVPKTFLALGLTVLLPLSGVADSPTEVPSFAKDVPLVKTSEPIFQFNGKDLTGFYTYTKDNKREDPNQVFTVKDGEIRVSGQEWGGFVTQEEYSNYHLIAEWRWGNKTWPPRVARSRDSGILLHCVGPDGAAGSGWMMSQECQIIEGGCGDFIMVGATIDGKAVRPSLTCETRVGPTDKQLYYEKGGNEVTVNQRYNWWGRDPEWKDVLGFRGKRDVEKPTGEWNRMEVICDGDTITNIVNGYVVNVGTKSSLTKGKILFQSEGAELFFRKIEVRPLVK